MRILKEFFSSVSIEVNPLSEGEYKELKEAGVDGLTLYQEVYHEETYSKLHVKGPKKSTATAWMRLSGAAGQDSGW